MSVNVDIPIIWTPRVSQTVLSSLKKLVNDFPSLPSASVFRNENPYKFRKVERKAEMKFEPKYKPNSEGKVSDILRNTTRLQFLSMHNLFSKANSQPKERAEKGSVAAQSKPSYLRASSWRVKSFTHTSSQSPTDPYLKWDAVYHHDNRSADKWSKLSRVRREKFKWLAKNKLAWNVALCNLNVSTD